MAETLREIQYRTRRDRWLRKAKTGGPGDILGRQEAISADELEGMNRTIRNAQANKA